MKTFSMIALALVSMTGTAMAQLGVTNTGNSTASSTGEVDAVVQVPLSITNEQGMDFGSNLERGTFATISVNSGGAARFFIEGDAGDYVSFVVDPFVTMTLDGPGTQILAGVNPVGGQSTTMLLETHSKINTINNALTAVEIIPAPDPLSTPGTVPGDGIAGSGTGQLYLFVGGDVTPNNDQQRGSYTGTINVSVSYSN